MIGSPRVPQPLSRLAEAAKPVAAQGPDSAAASGGRVAPHGREQQVRAAQTRLLFANASTGIVVALVVSALLAYCLRRSVALPVIAIWMVYVLAVSVGRLVLVNRYWRALPADGEEDPWRVAFAVGAGFAALGWAAAGVVFYPDTRSVSEIFLFFVLGGVMLGAASLLAARPEAFLTFLIPTGLVPALRLASVGDEEHLMMALLAALFTVATITTTWRFHQTIASSLSLGFENRDLVEGLQTAKDRADELNRDLEHRVQERTAKLVEADQRKDEFLATLAHELRNPLAPIRFAIESLKAGAPPTVASRAHEVIDRQVGQLVRLVDDLLDVSRITANKIHLRREPHALAKLMATAVESITPLARAADHTVHVELPPASVRVHGDATRLVQVFANILNNAVKFTPRGGHIWFTASQDASEAVVRIRDNGIGIASDVLPRVFDMFQQAEPILDRSNGGLGIGLTLARRLVEMHEGRIAVRSAGAGHGTEVEIRLPITTAADQPVVDAARREAVAARSLRVLIVDDNPDAAEMLDIAVSRLGHATRLAHDGASALAVADAFTPDVIFLDIGLPVMNGYTVARTLRSRPEFNHVHLAAVTGWGQDEDRRKAREVGFDTHFTKPLSPAVLEDLLAGIAQRTTGEGDPGNSPRTRFTDSGLTSA